MRVLERTSSSSEPCQQIAVVEGKTTYVLDRTSQLKALNVWKLNRREGEGPGLESSSFLVAFLGVLRE